MTRKPKNNEELADLWAQNAIDDMSASHSNMSFVGPVAYSYSTIVACKYPGYCMFAGTGIRRSVTTAKHIRLYERSHAAACRGDEQITVDIPAHRGYYGVIESRRLTTLSGLYKCLAYMEERILDLHADVRDAKHATARRYRTSVLNDYKENVERLRKALGVLSAQKEESRDTAGQSDEIIDVI